MVKKYNWFWRSLEKYFFSKLPIYKTRMDEMYFGIKENEKATNTFYSAGTDLFYGEKIDSNLKDEIFSFYKEKIIRDEYFKKNLMDLLKEGSLSIRDYRVDYPKHGFDKLIEDFNLNFLENLEVQTKLIKRPEIKKIEYIVGNKNHTVVELQELTECAMHFKPKTIYVRDTSSYR